MRVPSIQRSRTLASLLTGVALLTSPAEAHLGEHEEIVDIEKRLQGDPDNFDLLLKRAFLYRKTRHPELAMAELNALIHSHPEETGPVLERARTYRLQELWREAETDFTVVLQRHFRPESAFVERAEVRLELQNIDGAYMDYRAALEYQQPVEVHLSYIKFLKESDRGAEVGKAFERAQRDHSHSPILLRESILWESAQGHHAKAQALLEPLLASRSFRTPYLLLRGELHLAAGKRDLASQAFQEAVGECQALLGHRKAFNGIQRTYYAEALLASGQTNEARRELQAILLKNPSYPAALALQERLASTSQTDRPAPPGRADAATPTTDPAEITTPHPPRSR